MTTPREQLAETLQPELSCWLITYPTKPDPTTACDNHGEAKGSHCQKALSIADLIIQAGWTPPPTPTPATYLDN